jgi:D-Tyr-tRNAtyr deacylase
LGTSSSINSYLSLAFYQLWNDHTQGVPTQSGVFAAHMLVEIANDGPVTIWLEK